jgi:flagellar hook-length control protein FliK
MITLPNNLILPTDAKLSEAETAPREASILRSASEEFELVESVVNDGDSAFDEVFAGALLTMQMPNEQVRAEADYSSPDQTEVEPTDDQARAGAVYSLPADAGVEPTNDQAQVEAVYLLPADAQLEPTNAQAHAEAVNLLPVKAKVERAFAHDDKVEPQARTSVAKSQLLYAATELPATVNRPDTQSPRNADVVLNSLVPQQIDVTLTAKHVVVADQDATDHASKQHIPLDKNITQQFSSLPIPLVSSSQVSVRVAGVEPQAQTKHKPVEVSESNFVDNKQAVPNGLSVPKAATDVRPQNPGDEIIQNSLPKTVTKSPSEDETPPASRTTRDARLPLSKLAANEIPEALALAEQSRDLNVVTTDLVNYEAPMVDHVGELSGESKTIHLSIPLSVQLGSFSTPAPRHSFTIDNGVLIESVAREIIEQARIETGVDETRIELELDPPELGRVFVRLSETSEGITARIVVAKEHVWQALGESLADFQSTLADAGIDLRDFSLSQQGDEASQEFTGHLPFPNHAKPDPSSRVASNLTQHLPNYHTGSTRVVDIRA